MKRTPLSAISRLAPAGRGATNVQGASAGLASAGRAPPLVEAADARVDSEADEGVGARLPSGVLPSASWAAAFLAAASRWAVRTAVWAALSVLARARATRRAWPK